MPTEALEIDRGAHRDAFQPRITAELRTADTNQLAATATPQLRSAVRTSTFRTLYKLARDLDMDNQRNLLEFRPLYAVHCMWLGGVTQTRAFV